MKKIIVADSLQDFIEQEVSALKRHDNRFFYVKSGSEVLEAQRKERGDLIVMRPDFPDMTCEEICSEIRGDANLRRVSILIVCGDKPSDIERCQKCGVNDYLPALTAADFLRKTVRLLNISERTAYRVIVRVAHRGNHSANVFCTSRDISLSGILLETDQALNKGDRITCSFFLPGSVQICIEGEVARINAREDGGRDYGVKFVNVPASVESQIAAFIEKWLKKRRSR